MELIVLVYVLLMIAFAKGFGEVVTRINQPPIVGELLAGIVLGPFILGFVFKDLDRMYSDTFIRDLGDLGMLFLMLYVGLEFSPKLIKASSILGGLIAASGLVLPLVLGLLVGVLFELEGLTLAFVAVAISVTALPVTIRVLKDMEVLKSRTSATIISAALITDVLLLFTLGVILGSAEGSRTTERVLYLSVSFAFFFALAMLFGRVVVPRIYRLLKWMRTGEAAFAIAVVIAILFAVLAEWSGLPGVIGAFIAGMLLREAGTGLRVWARVEDILSGVTIGFLAPIFFVFIGFTVDFSLIMDHLPFFGVVTAVAILGKLAGSYLPARMSGLGNNESMAIGSMMMGKGAIELVFARLAVESGLIPPDQLYLFSVLVLMAFISTILAPVMFRTFYNRGVTSGEIPPGTSEASDVAEQADSSQYA
ncbi:MAG: hypothetical protein A3K76_04680 [Euryarchaeota archaeon RBG_13_57_23]|nr:MAG: hypothetical protein A3K76_04680 [Euryarchaeota archaeon RBG_13_57_23]